MLYPTVLNAKRLARLLTADHFERAIAPFVRAIHSEVLDLRYASAILVHFERLGPIFDQWARLLVQDMRDEGVYGDQGAVIARIVFDSFRDVSCSSSLIPKILKCAM